MSQQEIIEFMKTGDEVVSHLPKDEDEQPLLSDVGLCDILYSMVEGYMQSAMYVDNCNLVLKSLEAEGRNDPDTLIREFLEMHMHTVAHRVFSLGVGFCVMKEVR